MPWSTSALMARFWSRRPRPTYATNNRVAGRGRLRHHLHDRVSCSVTPTQVAAEANPDVPFSIVDFAYDPVIPNVRAHVYATAEGAFLAGYARRGDGPRPEFLGDLRRESTSEVR